MLLFNEQFKAKTCLECILPVLHPGTYWNVHLVRMEPKDGQLYIFIIYEYLDEYYYLKN